MPDFRPLDREPRVVLAGYGRWGRQCHSYLIDTTPGLTLAGIVSSSPDKRKQAEAERHCRTYRAFDEVLDDRNVDAVVLATPNYTHRDLAVRALNAGKHVVTDKVICLNLAEFTEMEAAAKNNNRLLTVFQNRRLDGDFMTIQKLVAEGRLGDLRWIEMSWQGFGPWGGWRGKPEMGGGRLYDLGAHLLDQILLLCPEPVSSVFCRMHHDLPDCEVESEAFVVIGFESGRTAVMDLSSLALIQKPRFYLRGTKASFMKNGLDPQEEALLTQSVDTARETPENYGILKSREGESVIPTMQGHWRGFYENLRDSLMGKAEPLVKLSQQERLVRVMDAARKTKQVL